MADIKFSVLSGAFKVMRDMLNGTYAEVVASANIVTDSTGQYTFDKASLPSAATYDANNNIVTVTYGPDANGRSFRKTSTWTNGVWMGDSAWVVV